MVNGSAIMLQDNVQFKTQQVGNNLRVVAMSWPDMSSGAVTVSVIIAVKTTAGV